MKCEGHMLVGQLDCDTRILRVKVSNTQAEQQDIQIIFPPQLDIRRSCQRGAHVRPSDCGRGYTSSARNKKVNRTHPMRCSPGLALS